MAAKLLCAELRVFYLVTWPDIVLIAATEKKKKIIVNHICDRTLKYCQRIILNSVNTVETSCLFIKSS